MVVFIEKISRSQAKQSGIFKIRKQSKAKLGFQNPEAKQSKVKFPKSRSKAKWQAKQSKQSESKAKFDPWVRCPLRW